MWVRNIFMRLFTKWNIFLMSVIFIPFHIFPNLGSLPLGLSYNMSTRLCLRLNAFNAINGRWRCELSTTVWIKVVGWISNDKQFSNGIFDCPNRTLWCPALDDQCHEAPDQEVQNYLTRKFKTTYWTGELWDQKRLLWDNGNSDMHRMSSWVKGSLYSFTTSLLLTWGCFILNDICNKQ